MPESDDNDATLFRQAIGAVKPLAPTTAPPAPPRPRPAARMAERDECDARSEFQRGLDDVARWEADDVLSFRRESVPPRWLQRLRKGQFSVQDELDLHGANAATAERWLRQFFHDAHAHGHGCVRIIHGKGRGSEQTVPVLKNLVDRILRQRADVLAFHSAPATQGGTGAVLVLLARR